MKVLHIIDHYSLGGAQRILEGILQFLPEATLLPLRKKGGHIDQIAIPDEKILLKPEGSLHAQMLRLLRAPRLIIQHNIQIVHCHLTYSWLFGLWLVLVLPARRRPHLIFHEHDSVKLVRWYYPLLIRAAARAGTLVAVSEYVKKQIVTHGIAPEDVRMLRNYVDLSRFSPGEPQSLEGLPLRLEQVQASRLVGFAGRLVGYKGWKYIIHAASRLCKKNIRFVIAGDGPDAGKLKELIAQMGLQDAVILLGYVDHMVDFYRSIDLLVIASEREAFGLVQLEAQACGVPVILYENQAAVELSGEQSSIIVPYGDVDAMIEKIESLLDDPAAYGCLVEKGLENVKNYDLAPYIRRLNDLYAQVVQGKGRP
jgi:glycosyltransferase involved in cell wall biosynthesis